MGIYGLSSFFSSSSSFTSFLPPALPFFLAAANLAACFLSSSLAAILSLALWISSA